MRVLVNPVDAATLRVDVSRRLLALRHQPTTGGKRALAMRLAVYAGQRRA